MHLGAIFEGNGTHSENSTYRYSLWRIWDETKPFVMFIGLNPTNYDDRTRNQTLSNLTKYTEQWGFGGFYLGNLFALITPNPNKLLEEPLSVVEENDRYLRNMAAKCEIIVAAWGDDGILLKRNKIIVRMFPKLYCFGTTKNGNPKHPARLPNGLKYELFD